MSANRHLLFGLLALQCGFVSKDQFVAAFSEQASEKSKSIELILFEQGVLSTSQLSLLAALLEEHLKQHGEDIEKSLAAIGSASSIKQALEELNDSEIDATLLHVRDEAKNVNQTSLVASLSGSHQRFVVLRPHAKGGLGKFRSRSIVSSIGMWRSRRFCH